MSSNETTLPPEVYLPYLCSKDLWQTFVMSSVIPLLGTILLVLFGRALCDIFGVCSPSKTYYSIAILNYRQFSSGVYNDFKEWGKSILCGQSFLGRMLVAFMIILNMAAFIIYLVDAEREFQYGPSVPDGAGGFMNPRICPHGPWGMYVTDKLNFALNLFFLVHFMLRAMSCDDKFLFVFQIQTLVDFFTIPHDFVALAVNTHWLGLRFLRVTCLLQMPDLFQYMKLLKTSSQIKLLQLASIFLSVWFSFAGVIFLIENTGDFYSNYEPRSNIMSYWTCTYFLLVTMSTVGYGDFYPEVVLGRVFTSFYIFIALAMFATFIPEMIVCLHREPYRGDYKKESKKPHVVLCGYINYQSVSNFLADFLHEDRSESEVEVVIINSEQPSMELIALVKANFSRVQYFNGSVMEQRDLERVLASEAESFLVLANKQTKNAEAEDMANIMRAISIKNYSENIRLLIQLLHYQNKAYLVNIPGWGRLDDVICLSELKLGFLAQSCLAPGFSTLLSNLFTMHSSIKKDGSMEKWQVEYLEGTDKEMYIERLSPSFIGLPFPEVAKICFQKLQILLIGVEISNPKAKDVSLHLNPGPDITIVRNTEGYFIASDALQVKKAFHYCHQCHADENDLSKIDPCRHSSDPMSYEKSVVVKSEINVAATTELEEEQEETLTSTKVLQNDIQMKMLPHLSPINDNNNQSSDIASSSEQSNPEVDQFHGEKKTSPAPSNLVSSVHFDHGRNIEEFVLTPRDARIINFQHHVVVCVFSDLSSPDIGLNNFILPLRSGSIDVSELKDIVFVGDVNYIGREWANICNYPRIFILDGNPLNRNHLKAVNINICDMCIIMSSKQERGFSDATLRDKEAILCSLNIKTMKFSAAELRHMSPDAKRYGSEIPIITEIEQDRNVQFLDNDDEDDSGCDLYLTQSFACGVAFSVSVLDSLLSTAYFDCGAMLLIRSLVTGGMSDSQTAAGDKDDSGTGGDSGGGGEAGSGGSFCKIAQISLSDKTLSPAIRHFEKAGGQYGDLVFLMMRDHNHLCIGLYRLISERCTRTNLTKRYVITAPDHDMHVLSTDKVFCLQSASPKTS